MSVVMVLWGYTYTKTYQIVHFKYAVYGMAMKP